MTLSRQQIEEMLVAAYVRGVEWHNENRTPADFRYRFKAARDYADKTLALQALDAGQPVAYRWRFVPGSLSARGNENDWHLEHADDFLKYAQSRPDNYEVQLLYRAPPPASSVEALRENEPPQPVVDALKAGPWDACDCGEFFLNWICGMRADGSCSLAGTEDCDWEMSPAFSG
jgi:hypothetical protein